MMGGGLLCFGPCSLETRSNTNYTYIIRNPPLFMITCRLYLLCKLCDYFLHDRKNFAVCNYLQGVRIGILSPLPLHCSRVI